MQADLDLGFRSLLPILFQCLPARVVMLHIVDEHGRPSTASLLIQDLLERVYPAQGKREQSDLAFERQIYRADGETLLLPDGEYRVSSGARTRVSAQNFHTESEQCRQKLLPRSGTLD